MTSFAVQYDIIDLSFLPYQFSIFDDVGVCSPETPTYKNLWIKNLLAEICHFTTQKYKNLHV